MEHYTSNEKSGSSNNWRSGLDQLCSLPAEEKQDMNAAWDTLSTKLNLKKGGKTSVGYWIAAASLAVIIIASVITSTSSNKAVIVELVKNYQPVKKTESKELFNKQPRETVIKTLLKDKKYSAAKHTIINIDPNYLLKIPDTLFQITAQNEDNLMASTITAPALSNKSVSFPVLKKKLPVVHINDIDKPLDPVEIIAGNNDHGRLHIRLFNRDIRVESPAVNNENNNALKIKLSPQN